MKLIITTLFLVFQLTSFAHALKGLVTDPEGEGVAGAFVHDLSNGNHAHTNEFGYFVFENASLGDTLEISLMGFIPQRVIVKDFNHDLNIVLRIDPIILGEVVISSQANALKLATDIDIQTSPVRSSQEILRKVPGITIGQHAGGGKAEQIFLRGFDIDHGTDINITVDGLPVNMVSHAHGQGYADMHFVIPETIEKIDWGKGPYDANKGNFATAGYVNFRTKQKLDESLIKFEVGQFNTQRVLSMLDLVNSKKHNAYLATEYLTSDGPFDSPQHFSRLNILGKYYGQINPKDKLGVSLSYFTSNWDASGQIPQRAVDNGSIGRFGAIDDTEGGQTSRTNLVIQYDKEIDDKSTIKNTLFLSKYDFELYSNFTFFLEDQTNGDQIRQKEGRTLYGLKSEYKRYFNFNDNNAEYFAGIYLRNDQSRDNELSNTTNREETRSQVRFGDINESNWAAFTGTKIDIKKWSFKPSVRIDLFQFEYIDDLATSYGRLAEDKLILSPKFDIYYHPSQHHQLYLKTGKGFHSNDSRVSSDPTAQNVIPPAYGFDVGYISKPNKNILFNIAYWYLFLAQEFVYVGDAGIVEPSGKTRRHGVELSVRHQVKPWLSWNIDANYTLARAIEEPSGENYIPLAPDFTFNAGISMKHPSGLYGGIHFRYLDDRPANEDNSIIAKGYAITDMNFGYRWKKLDFGVDILNVFNREWNETQFATESRLAGEANGIEEIHFTPGNPFTLKASISYRF